MTRHEALGWAYVCAVLTLAIAAGVTLGLLAYRALAPDPVSASRPAAQPGLPHLPGRLTTAPPSPDLAQRTSGPDRYPTRSAALAAPVAGAAAISGIASWYCLPGRSSCTAGYPPTGKYAAAGPALRTGNWRGRTVTVTAGGRSVTVELVDACLCRDGRVIDLYSIAFRRLAPLSRGVIPVTVEW